MSDGNTPGHRATRHLGRTLGTDGSRRWSLERWTLGLEDAACLWRGTALAVLFPKGSGVLILKTVCIPEPLLPGEGWRRRPEAARDHRTRHQPCPRRPQSLPRPRSMWGWTRDGHRVPPSHGAPALASKALVCTDALLELSRAEIRFNHASSTTGLPTKSVRLGGSRLDNTNHHHPQPHDPLGWPSSLSAVSLSKALLLVVRPM